MTTSFSRLLGMAITVTIFSSSVLAQFVWIDEKGNKQFSDQPPPASVPKSKIIKSAENTLYSPYTPDTDKKDAPSQSVAEKEMAYKKRQNELMIKEKKEAEEAKIAANKAENCKRMTEYKQSLNSGQRISQTDEKGERSYMTDEKRVQEQKELSEKMDGC